MLAELKQKKEDGEQFSSRILLESAQAVNCIAQNRVGHRRSGALVKWLFPADVLITFLAYSAFVSFSNGFSSLVGFDIFAVSMMSAFLIICTSAVGAYNKKQNLSSLRYFCEHMVGSLMAFFFAVVMSFLFLTVQHTSNRTTILLTMIVAPCLTAMLRRAYGLRLRKKMGRKSLLIIGDGPASEEFVYWLGIIKSAFSVSRIGPQSGLVYSSDISGVNLVGATMEQAIQKLDGDLEAVVITCKPDNLPVSFLNSLVAIDFNVVPVYTLESFNARMWQTVPLSTLSALWALEEGFTLSRSETYERIKRGYDILLSGLALLVLSPLLLALAALIKLDSCGPVIFKQQRIGFREKPFMLFKFRSMRVGSEKGEAYTSENDRRITRVGAFIRLTRLDELPQFFNVLRGDMSLIGPRAEWDKLVKDYEQVIPYYHFRHLVKPGITGWAQVNYPYGANVNDTRNKLRYDLYYVRYFSFMLDFSIIVKTVFVMLFGKGR